MTETYMYSFTIPVEYYKTVEHLILNFKVSELNVKLCHIIDFNEEYRTYEITIEGNVQNIKHYYLWVNGILESVKNDYLKKL